jgi:hypothetical protein
MYKISFWVAFPALILFGACGDKLLRDADQDGFIAKFDCNDEDPESLVALQDADCDGTLTADDCDDTDASSTVLAEDGDCDGTPTADDCDDADPNSTILAEDGDCDGVIAAQDCDDADPTSYTVAEDGDCDGTRKKDDCDDNDASVNPDADDTVGDGVDQNCDGADGVDADGDGWASLESGGEDCDDSDQQSTYISIDGDCDGTKIDDDCDDNDPTREQLDVDGDGYTTCDGDCDDSDASLDLSDLDQDGYNTCDGDCDDSDDSLELDDSDADGFTTCDGDCNDNNPNVLPSDCYQDYQIYIKLSDLVNQSETCSSNHYYGNGDYGFEWTDSEGGSPSSITIRFYSGIGCDSGSFDTELNGVSTGSVTLSGECECTPNPDIIIRNLTNISGFIPNGTNQFLIEGSDAMGLSSNSNWDGGSYAIVKVSY